jgi:hypothetical protein
VRTLLPALVVASALAPAVPASAQTAECTGAQDVCAVSGVVSIDISLAVHLVMPASVSVATATPEHFATGLSPATGFHGEIKANGPWSLGISALNSTFTAVPSDGSSIVKPASDAAWALGTGEFTPLSTTVAAVTTGTATAGTLVTLSVRTAYVFQQDGPGTYTLPLVLTITAP